MVKISVIPNDFKTSKSLSPVIRKSALESCASESKKLSFWSLQIITSLLTSQNSAYSWIVSIRFSVSYCEKNLLNFGLLITDKNSVSNSSLKDKMQLLENKISSSCE